ncbi:MAG: hypothetical protein E7350_03290 [Clostridiales bacterium]|nr:hypothetical protein [Clostridiales bacterium]
MKAKNQKRSFLLSVLSLILCISMFVGTTFAWFTDTVTSSNNKIEAGNLDIELYYQVEGSKDWERVTEKTNIFKQNALWEPGHTEVVKLKAVNEGSLALEYQLGINVVSETGSVNQKGEPFKLSDYIMYGIVEGEQSYTRETAVAAVDETAVAIKNNYTQAGTLLAEEESIITMVVYMPTYVGNEVNAAKDAAVPTIFLGLNVFATQTGYEEDSFGNGYDENAAVVVEPGESIADAISKVEDGGIVFLNSGVHNVASGPIVVEGKDFTVKGIGNVVINKNYGSTHIFTVKNGANVTIENVTMDGKGNTRDGIFVRWNSTVTLKNVVIKNTGGYDISIDEASDAEHGESTASYVHMINSHIEDIGLCASPVTSVAATQDTYAYFNYDASSTVGAIDVQSINLKPENIIINGVKSTEVGKTMYINVKNDAELAAALNTIKTNSAYWNKQVYVNLAAGEYSADHVINQYPEWNGVVGAGATANNYASGVPAGAPNTVITFVGESATVAGARTLGATAAPSVVFTGNVTVNGFGNAGAGFNSATAVTTFQNVAFDGASSIESNNEDYIVMYLKAAASNVSFDGCTFVNATHVTLGGSAANAVGTVSFDGCTFNDGGCLSGYMVTLNVSNTLVTAAKNGFINKSTAGAINVENCDITAGKYFLRTASGGKGVQLFVNGTEIEMYESDGSKHLVYFRGGEESASFQDCTIADGYTTAGVDAGSTLEIYNFSEVNGITLITDGISGVKSLYKVPAEYEGTVVNVPEGVENIGGYAFAYNSNIEEIVLPSTVKTLGDRAFRDTSASTVVLNEGLTNISYQAFRNALNVKSVEIPSTVTTISKEAFQNSGITTLEIPANVTTIEYGGCRDMKKLEHVVIEGNVDIPVYAFRACENLKTVELKGTDVTFGGGSRGMIFTNKENGDGSAITVTVANEVIKERLLAADTAAKDYGGYTIICLAQANEDGTFTDESGKVYAYADDTDEVTASIRNGATELYLSAGTYNVPSVAVGKEITIKGNKDTVVSIPNTNTAAGGSTLNFEGVTVKGQSSGNYAGMGNGTKANFTNCTFEGKITLYGTTKFTNCVFNNTNDYAVWTWGAGTVEFIGCTFNSGGKALLVYANVLDNGTTHQTVKLTDCIFNDSGDLQKAAIEVGDDYGRSYDLIINNVTVNGFDVTEKKSDKGGDDLGTNVWGNKNLLTKEKLNVVIDGVDVH